MVNPKNESDSITSRRNSGDMRGVRSSGREPYVFQVNKPEGLLGVHAGLMEKVLCPDEGLHYLLYSPICREKKGPFGLRATPASHAVAVTKHRFVISEDRHTEGIAPTVQSIPFDQVLYVQLGNSLLLGWFSLKFTFDDKASCATLFFPAPTGMKHFGLAVREYRRIVGRAYDQVSSEEIDWADIWQHTLKPEMDHLKPLILEEEIPFHMLRSSERWILRKRWWRSVPAYLSTNGILLCTNFGFIHAMEEPGIRPEIFSFGVNVSCISPYVLKSAQLLQKSMYGRVSSFLKLKIARRNVAVDLNIPFDESHRDGAEALVHVLAQNTRREKGACIL